jgi:hypothetical protein
MDKRRNIWLAGAAALIAGALFTWWAAARADRDSGGFEDRGIRRPQGGDDLPKERFQCIEKYPRASAKNGESA